MKYLITLMLCFLTCSLSAKMDDKDLITYLRTNIDSVSYEFSHTDNQHKKDYYNGYMDALSQILYIITIEPVESPQEIKETSKKNVVIKRQCKTALH